MRKKKRKTKTLWKTLAEKKNPQAYASDFQNEFAQELPVDAVEGSTEFSRRDFLKIMGFGVAGVAAACSRMPVKKSIPYLVQPENAIPGKAYWYATMCSGCSASCGALVKTREGRPIKMEGNPQSPLNRGGLCAVGQALLLDLYDSSRLKAPVANQQPLSPSDWNAQTLAVLKSARGIGFVTSPQTSPTTRALMEDFKKLYPQARILEYEANAASACLQAHEIIFGKKVFPHLRFDLAKTIVSIGADFLGTWVSPVEFAKQYRQSRDLKGAEAPAQHFQIESRLSLTGANADVRIPLAPTALKGAILVLVDRVLRGCGQDGLNFAETVDLGHRKKDIRRAADALLKNRGKSLLVSDIDDVTVQTLIVRANLALENYQRTLDLSRPSLQKRADSQNFSNLLAEVQSGKIDVLIFAGVNPVYDYPDALGVKQAFGSTKTIVFAERLDETAALANFVSPLAHSLESWTDAEPVSGTYHMNQPVISPIYQAAPWQETVLYWMGKEGAYFDAIQTYWRNEVFSKQSRFILFDRFWRQVVHDGVFADTSAIATSLPQAASINVSAAELQFLADSANQKRSDGGFEIEVFESIALRDGRFANNPWLQELPDPISKVTWENPVQVSPKDAESLGLEDGDIVLIKEGARQIKCPVIVQPGQALNSVAIAVGYGHSHLGKVADQVGVNVYPFAKAKSVFLEKTGNRSKLAQTQTHYGMEGRPLVRDAQWKEYQKNPSAGNEQSADLVMLWHQHETKGHSWGMAIDLNACIGCSGCLVSCQSENNVPVVGKEEVANSREMHWIRLDRYYKGEEDNPEVLFQPMMCQHCGNAPCESVCPVLATVHSEDGLNQQVYNRCVGTRYCANNCPYKVRRFNWFDYANNKAFDYNMNDDVGRLAINPDIVVRSRGVMEKCSMCIQRIQEKKLEAKVAGEPLNSDQIQTACQQSCPSDAIVFGDLNDPASRISLMLQKNPRRYNVLGELNVKPAVNYLTKVRNTE